MKPWMNSESFQTERERGREEWKRDKGISTLTALSLSSNTKSYYHFLYLKKKKIDFKIFFFILYIF